jgi:dCMP deaminase
VIHFGDPSKCVCDTGGSGRTQWKIGAPFGIDWISFPFWLKVGACIVSQDRVILGIGYNGFPRGCSDDELPWAKVSVRGDPLETKYPYVCHAEVNAILNKNHASAAGQRLYVTLFPCNECAKVIIQAGIAEVVYFADKGLHTDNKIGGNETAYVASRKLLAMAGVKVWQHQPVAKMLVLEFK